MKDTKLHGGIVKQTSGQLPCHEGVPGRFARGKMRDARAGGVAE